MSPSRRVDPNMLPQHTASSRSPMRATNSGSPGSATVTLPFTATNVTAVALPSRRGSPGAASPRNSPSPSHGHTSHYGSRPSDYYARDVLSRDPFRDSSRGFSTGTYGGTNGSAPIDLHSNIATFPARLKTYLGQAGIFAPANSIGYDSATGEHHIGEVLVLDASDRNSLPLGLDGGTQLGQYVPDMSPAARAAFEEGYGKQAGIGLTLHSPAHREKYRAPLYLRESRCFFFAF